jgi:hypothetical protein
MKIEPNVNLLKLMKEPERVAKRGKPPKGLLSSTILARLEGFYSNKKSVEEKPSSRRLKRSNLLAE